jgi:two-component system, sensor histidine kinase
LAKSAFDLAAVVNSTLVPFATQAQAKGLAFETDIQIVSTGWHLGDGKRLAQVIAKLVQNAVTFTDHGAVRVVLQAQPDGLHITISDTGAGMTADQQARAFDAFMQADVSAQRRYDGAGLGLPIARALVQGMGGTLAVSSVLRQGSRFEITLPLAQTDAPAPVPVTTPPPLAAGRPLAILAAEDNKANQRVLIALLKDVAADITIADNGQIALERAKATDFDLFLFDIMMPEMDGLTAFREISKDYRRTGRPVPRAIAVTANVSPDQLRDYHEAGFDDVIAKPIRKAQLLALCAPATALAAE